MSSSPEIARSAAMPGGAPLPQPPLRLRLDRDALIANWRTLHRLGGGAETGAAVKADAYGLGARALAPVLREAGTRQFYVAHWGEAAALLGSVPAAEISVLSGVRNGKEARYARALGLRPVINSLEQAAIWRDYGAQPGDQGQRVDVMVDTGINRLGLRPSELGDPLISTLSIDTLMSHLASADEDSAMNARQLAAFRAAAPGTHARRLSLANSAGIALGRDYHFDLTRPGLSLYGGIARPELADEIRQVAYPQAALLQLRDIAAGESVGYNARWTAAKPTRIGVISIGYADGMLRARSAAMRASFAGAPLPLLGKISMDMIVVDCAKTPDIRVGDWVDIAQQIYETSQLSGLSQYEILTLTGQRFNKCVVDGDAIAI